jgi:predicted transposase YdaD
MGLRVAGEVADHLLEGVANMRESTTYQAILREGREEGLMEGRNEGLIQGRVEEARRMLLMLGEVRCGTPDEATRAAVEAIQDIDRLEALCERILDPGLRDWSGLLRTP